MLGKLLFRVGWLGCSAYCMSQAGRPCVSMCFLDSSFLVCQTPFGRALVEGGGKVMTKGDENHLRPPASVAPSTSGKATVAQRSACQAPSTTVLQIQKLYRTPISSDFRLLVFSDATSPRLSYGAGLWLASGIGFPRASAPSRGEPTLTSLPWRLRRRYKESRLPMFADLPSVSQTL